MRVNKLGSAEPEYAIIAGIHGDEPEPVKALEKFEEQGFKLKKGLKVIIANEKALEEQKRFLDVDLNRSFPGDSKSDKHEEQLASKIMDEIEGLKVLDMHTTSSKHSPFVIVGERKDKDLEMAKSTGISRVIDMTYVEGGIANYINGVVVESTKDQNAAEELYKTLINFLAAEKVIEKEFVRSKPELYDVYTAQEGENFEFTAQNFEKVEKGEIYAKKEDEVLRAEKDFYPVLMSTEGYDTIIGFKADKKKV